MADNFVTNPGTGGATFASDDIGGIQYPRAKQVWGADGVGNDTSVATPLPVQLISNAVTALGSNTNDGAGTAINSLSAGTGANGLMVAQGATNFFVSTLNSTTAQLAASATYTGTIEAVLSAPYASIIIDCDQPGILVVKQYITSTAGTQCIQTSFTTVAKVGGNCFGRSFPINGNYFSITFQNTGASATTTLNINTAYGNINSATQLLNAPVALNEINGTALSLGQTTMAASLPVVLASNQAAVPVTSSNPAAVLTNQVAVTATAAAIGSGALSNGVVITALSTNALTVYVGPAGVTTANGYPLLPGQSISFGVTNLNAVFCIASSTGSSLAYAGN
jgi:hypothetical protein